MLWRLGILLAFLLPSIAGAQSADLIASLRAQIAVIETRILALDTASQGGISCPVLTRSLLRGMRGDDVRQLQDFLRHERVFAAESTGFFGTLTEAAVKEWQSGQGIVRQGGDTTGWGIVGPRTRAAIVDRCGEIARPPAPGPTEVHVVPIPAATSSIVTNDSAPATSTVQCLGTGCVTTQGNRAPSLFGIDGPEELEVGESGRYAILAHDPDNDRLTYEIDWGGGTTPLDALYALAGIESSSAGNSFVHSFPSAGLYIVTATVRDSKGNSARATLNVRVSAVSTVCHSCATSTPLFTPETAPEIIQIPTGITSCATPWGGVILQSGRTIPATPYFRGSVSYTGDVPLMRCREGRWERCDAAGANCITHAPPRSNASMLSLRRYADVVGAGGCGGLGSGTTALAEPRTLLCANVIHQAPQGRCAYTQENTAVELFCSYNNWAERLTLQ